MARPSMPRKRPHSISSLVVVCLCMLMFIVYAHASQDDLEELDRLFKLGEYAQTIEKLNEIPRERFTSEHFRFLIFSHAADDLDDAEEAAQQAIKQLSTEPDVYLMHASIMGSQASNSVFSALSYAEKALKSLQTAVDLAPEETKYRQALVSFYLNAPGIAGGDTDMALEHINIIEDKDVIEGKILMAWYYRTIDEEENARSTLEQANKDFPNNISIFNALASHHIAQENYAKAISYYQLLTRVDLVSPLNEELERIEEHDQARYSQLNAHYQIGRSALVGNVRYEEGIEHMNTFISTIINPDAIGVLDTSGLPSIDWAKLRLAGLYLANNQIQEAQEAFADVDVDKDDDNMMGVYNKLKKRL